MIAEAKMIRFPKDVSKKFDIGQLWSTGKYITVICKPGSLVRDFDDEEDPKNLKERKLWMFDASLFDIAHGCPDTQLKRSIVAARDSTDDAARFNRLYHQELKYFYYLNEGEVSPQTTSSSTLR